MPMSRAGVAKPFTSASAVEVEHDGGRFLLRVQIAHGDEILPGQLRRQTEFVEINLDERVLADCPSVL